LFKPFADFEAFAAAMPGMAAAPAVPAACEPGNLRAELDHARRQLADGVPYCRFCPHCDDPMAPEEWDELAELRAWKRKARKLLLELSYECSQARPSSGGCPRCQSNWSSPHKSHCDLAELLGFDREWVHAANAARILWESAHEQIERLKGEAVALKNELKELKEAQRQMLGMGSDLVALRAWRTKAVRYLTNQHERDIALCYSCKKGSNRPVRYGKDALLIDDGIPHPRDCTLAELLDLPTGRGGK